jgi:catechol 2,3-dioxygenase-like lactoylglutathione lyase family enzyme
MTIRLATVSFVVADLDAAIGFFTNALGFRLVEDTLLDDGKRWVLVEAPGGGSRLLLAKASGAAQVAAIGNQTGGRVGFFLESTDFAADHARMLAAGVIFLEEPRHEPYGTVAVFRDVCGNLWDLIQMRR